MSVRIREVDADQLVPPRGIEVPQGEWRLGNKLDSLYTEGLEECIGIGVFDPVRKVGHLAHVLATIESQDTVLPEFIESVVEGCEGNTGRLNVCLAGGQIDDDSIWLGAEALRRREQAIHQLEGRGIGGPWAINWNEEMLPQNLELDCSTGNYRLTKVHRVRKTNVPAITEFEQLVPDMNFDNLSSAGQALLFLKGFQERARINVARAAPHLGLEPATSVTAQQDSDIRQALRAVNWLVTLNIDSLVNYRGGMDDKKDMPIPRSPEGELLPHILRILKIIE